MTVAYNESYLDDAMQNLGDMVEYAVCDCDFDPDEFFAWFISSGIASKFEKGNPKYVSGMSGFELAEAVLKATNITHKNIAPSHPDFKGREYWAGWIFAYYQWQSGRRFADIVADGLTLSAVMGMYIHHEADNSKFVESANAIIRRNKESRKSKLHTIRKARGFTQGQLSAASGVSLRMIQLYEQKQNDLGKAQVNVVLRLAKALGCEVEDLID
ncbi:MAG: helix-turn-helix transcriptional regulator [Ruminococcaceae bacterium]|nr:helix-turn-helix transcriptional regulator [Oscillospiraceae bacterium]